jgi:predicted RNase H-like HicB family nuclease
MEGTRYTVILVPDERRWYSVLVPAMPGCASLGRTREDALANSREAMAGWLEAEAEHDRGPLPETSALVLDSVSRALQVIDEMRDAGEVTQESGYGLELATPLV